MKTKLAKKRAEGRGGWEGPTCSAELLSNLLRKHVEKGDPLDVGNLAMMLHQRGDRISTASALAAEARREALEEAAKHLSEIANAMWERCEVQRPADPTEISHGEKEDATTAWCFDKAAAAIRALANPARREGE